MRRLLAAILVATTLGWLPAIIAPPATQAATACTGWKSTRIPPTTIRVYRTVGAHSGTVQTVDFKKYVEVVMASEWPASWPAEAVKVGAITVKEYAWFRAINWRGGSSHGSCYDVIDNTTDQVYWPEGRTPLAGHIAATEATWDMSITRAGALFSTGYRSGEDVPCASDRDGSHIFQHSVRRCALAGLTAAEIVNLYYDPGIAVWSQAPQPSATFTSPGDFSQTTAGSSLTASWVEGPASSATITARKLSLTMAAPVNGSCDVERWVATATSWKATGASPQTATGLHAGFCYRFVLTLTDSTGKTTRSESGTVLADPLAPMVSFGAPATGTFATTTATSATVSWTERPTPGTHLVARSVQVEYAAAPVQGSCAGAMWVGGARSTGASPLTVALTDMYCYRVRVTVTDSAGHTGSWLSGVLAG